jgi:hypothetical protein
MHGTAYEFLRNSGLDAPNYFGSGRVPPFKRNQFGGAIGGPLWKDHTFLFIDYEGNRQSTGITNTVTVPSALARAGHLSTGDVSVDSSAQKYLTFWPSPNGPLLAAGDTEFTSLRVSWWSMRTSRPSASITNLRTEIVCLGLLRSMTRPIDLPTA